MTAATLERAPEASTRAPAARTAEAHYRRFDPKTRVLHVVVMTTFLGLAATGLPLLFSEAPWSGTLVRVFGGFYGAGILHRAFGATLLLAVAWHVADVLWRAFVRGEPGLLWGPDSLVPQPRDVVQLWQQLKWFAEQGPRPKFERFTYWEKFDYWAVLWGTGLMGAAGLVLWFPIAASRVLPGWMFNLALFVHGAEATLAIVFIFVVHFFNGHLRPGKFPMDMVIFTGAVTDEELRRERAGQYERLVADRTLEALAVPAPSETLIVRGRLLGTIALSIGLALFVLILYATLQ